MSTTAAMTPDGLVNVTGTTYLVYRMPVHQESARAGVVQNFALQGPRGAQYFVTLWKDQRLSVSAIGGARPWMPNPSAIGKLKFLTASDLAPFTTTTGGR